MDVIPVAPKTHHRNGRKVEGVRQVPEEDTQDDEVEHVTAIRQTRQGHPCTP